MKQPNIVICLCDQLRSFEVGCYGNKNVRTPNIDSLAAGGVRFETACTNNPVCTPARSALLSGQYTRTCINGASNAPEPVRTRDKMPTPTIAEVFKSAGYKTGLIGKWHLHTDPELLGFDSMLYPFHSHRYTGQTYYSNRRENTLIEGFNHEYEIEALKKWIPDHKDKPFFLYYNISQPHMPLDDAPERYKTMYDPEKLPLRDNVWNNEQISHDERWFRIYLWDYLFYQHHLPYTENLPENFGLKDLTALYYGLVSWADDQLGELMRVLEQNGLAENTIVIFTSDHGDLLGSHNMFNKDELYEEAVRIPMILRWPSKIAPRVADEQITSLVDVMPTLLSLAGIDVPDYVQGTDLSPVVLGEKKTTGANAAFIETLRSHVGLRTLTHKLGYKKDHKTGAVSNMVFYDLTADPMEQNNLAETGEQMETRETLCRQLKDWDAATPWMPRIEV